MNLTPQLATLALGRIAALRDQKKLDPSIDETRYWAYLVACYFSPYASLTTEDEAAESASVLLSDLLDELQIQDKGLVCVPYSFQVPPAQVAAVECEKMIVYQDSIAFTAIPKHSSFHVQTVEIPITVLEAALAVSPSTTQA